MWLLTLQDQHEAVLKQMEAQKGSDFVTKEQRLVRATPIGNACTRNKDASKRRQRTSACGRRGGSWGDGSSAVLRVERGQACHPRTCRHHHAAAPPGCADAAIGPWRRGGIQGCMVCCGLWLKGNLWALHSPFTLPGFWAQGFAAAQLKMREEEHRLALEVGFSGPRDLKFPLAQVFRMESESDHKAQKRERRRSSGRST